MCQVNGKAKNSTPHCLHIFQPIFLKLKNKNDIQDATQRAKFGWCGTTRRGLRKWQILAYFWFFLLFVLFALRPDHTVGPITTNEGSKCVSAQKSAFWVVSMTKSNVYGSKLPKNMIIGGLNKHFKPNLQNFKSRYLEKYKLDQCKIWRASLGPQTGFVGGPALQNNDSKRRRPPSWIFAQTLITQAAVWVRLMKFCMSVASYNRKQAPKVAIVTNSRWRRTPSWFQFIAHSSLAVAYICTKFGRHLGLLHKP